MPDVFSARNVATTYGEFGYIRIYTFNVTDAADFVSEFIRLAALLPQNGLIIDVRDNGGGLIYAGEELLQVLTPRQIEPERLQLICTPLNRRLCKEHSTDLALQPWVESLDRSIETGATFSAPYPITDVNACNVVGQRYQGPVVLVTNARCYSTTDFFAAGFQDHMIGPILGADDNTGAGGANVWTHNLLRQLFEMPSTSGPQSQPSPFITLPRDTGMRVALRRSLRVGAHAGTELEDLGVQPDARHMMTKDDVLHENNDLIEHAASLLIKMPVYVMSAVVTGKSSKDFALDIVTKGVERVDIAIGGHPGLSQLVGDGSAKVVVTADPAPGTAVYLKGYKGIDLVVASRVTL
jgi:C-terminal processing protease CtpA/Prc